MGLGQSPHNTLSEPSDRYTSLVTGLICVLIVLTVCLLFGRSIHFDFINYDDPAYVYENEMVAKGVTSQGVVWAMTEVGKTNLWHPMTWLSHMTDVEVFGVEKVGGHHAVNVFWHALGSVGLFFLMRRITGSTGITLFLALLWAIHPQRVQSVMWISERKDVLSGAFFMWSWWSWEKWRASRPGNLTWYGLALALFMLAGLSKPSVVPLPLILWLREMLRDRGGLNMGNGVRWGIRVIPFVVVSALVAGLTIYFQRTGGMADVTDVMPASRRLMLMPVSLWWYVQNFALPIPGQLWVYPPSGKWSDLLMPVVGLTIFCFLMLAIARRDRTALLGAGSLFLLWLPVSGIVPVSFYFVADRYSYLIQIGLLLILASLVKVVSQWAVKSIDRKWMTATAAMVVIMASIVTWGRVGYWKGSETLFTHECAINPRSLLAPIHLGSVKEDQGKLESALGLYREAMANDSESGLATNNTARVLEKLGKKDEAMAMYQAATKKRILHSEAAFSHLARLMLERGDVAGAESALRAGMERFPGRASLLVDYGSLALSHQQNRTAALEWYEKALAIDPYNADAMQGKGAVLIEMGEFHEGKEVLKELLKHHPERQAVREFLQRMP